MTPYELETEKRLRKEKRNLMSVGLYYVSVLAYLKRMRELLTQVNDFETYKTVVDEMFEGMHIYPDLDTAEKLWDYQDNGHAEEMFE